jgi:predicted MPP superfamily phosphohydrolase
MVLRILHLSDVHLNSAKLADFSLVFNALRQRVDAVIRETAPPDMVVFSGDLVQAGAEADDFDLAREKFIEPIIATAKIDRSRLFIVPGNHDIDRKAIAADTLVDSSQREKLISREALNSFIDANIKGPQEYHFARLLPYRNFARGLSAAPIIRTTQFFTTHRTNILGKLIGVACLNNAWRASGEPNDVDYGQLLLGERAVHEALNDIGDCEIKIAVFHHPISWLKQFDQFDCRPLLLKEFDLLLSGHTHHARPELVDTPTGNAIISEGGALYVNRRWFNGFCLITLAKEEARAQFDLWRYEDDNAQYVFAPATNVAPLGVHRFALKNAVEVQRFADVESACRSLLPIITTLANEHMLSSLTDSNAPKSLQELYVSGPLKDRSSLSNDPTNAVEIAETDLLESEEPVLVFGRRESGKTTLALRLCLMAISAEQKRIPIYLDLSQIKAGSDYLLRAIKRVIGAAELDLAKHLAQGDLIIVIDNFSNRQRDARAFKRKVDMVTKFIEVNNKNHFVLFSDDTEPVLAKVEKAEKFDFGYKSVYIHPLRRSNIRELARRWLEPSGQYTPTNVKAVLDKLAAFNLPRTAQVVSMVLWTLEKERTTGPVNEASLLQRFVEANLNKSDPSNIERATLDFVIKEAFLSHLAHHFKTGDLTQCSKNDLVLFVVNFFKSRSWHYDAADFVDDLLQRGVLVQYTDDEGTYVQFRFRCLQEYFEARYLQDNTDALDALFQSDGYVDSVREIDIMTGLARNNATIVERLSFNLEQMASGSPFNSEEQIAAFNAMTFQYFKADSASLAIASEVREAGATDDEINALLDMSDESPREQPASVENKNAEQQHSVSLKYFSTALLLSKVIRNNELLDNEELKIGGIKKSVDAWCYFASVGNFAFDSITKREAAPEALERFNRLDQNEKVMVEFVMKCFLPLIITAFAWDSLGTEKLYMVFTKTYDEIPKANVLRRLIVLSVLMSVGFSMFPVPKAVMDRAREFIKECPEPIALLLSILLFGFYLNPFLGNDNRRKVEDLMLEISVKLAPGPAANKRREAIKGGLLSQLRKLRGENDLEDDDE